jgi:hypothetical protein
MTVARVHLIEEDMDEDIGDFSRGGRCLCHGGLCGVRVDWRRQQAAGTGILATLLDGVLQLEGC